MSQILIYILLAASLCLLSLILLRLRQRSKSGTAQAEPTVALPDLREEEVGPEALPPDGWMKLVDELLSRGELRLALRALYLASLSFLADQGLIVVARFKSNRDYARELGRRSHALPGLSEAFSMNVALFDRSWYGMHEVTPGLMREFRENWERMKSLVSP